MKTLFIIVALALGLQSTNYKKRDMHKVRTPDGNSFEISIIPKQDANKLEKRYETNKLDDSLIPISHRPAYFIDNGQILYRQFYEDIGFIFPTINDYKIGTKGNSYYNANIQPIDKNGLVVAFGLMPAFANGFREKAAKELTAYETFEGREFYLLNDSSVVILRKRTPALSDGYWFNSIKDFDYFYYVLSGKEVPEKRFL